VIAYFESKASPVYQTFEKVRFMVFLTSNCIKNQYIIQKGKNLKIKETRETAI